MRSASPSRMCLSTTPSVLYVFGLGKILQPSSNQVRPQATAACERYAKTPGGLPVPVQALLHRRIRGRRRPEVREPAA